MVAKFANNNFSLAFFSLLVIVTYISTVQANSTSEIDLSGEWTYLGNGKATIVNKGKQVKMHLSWMPSPFDGPHYEVNATLSENTMSGDWRLLIEDKNFDTLLKQGGFSAKVGEDKNSIHVFNTEDNGHNWNSVVLTRASFNEAEPVIQGWNEYGTGDCAGNDVDTSEGANPDHTKAKGGVIAVCWDGVRYINSNSPGRAFCTYKDVAPDRCTGGSNVGFMYSTNKGSSIGSSQAKSIDIVNPDSQEKPTLVSIKALGEDGRALNSLEQGVPFRLQASYESEHPDYRISIEIPLLASTVKQVVLYRSDDRRLFLSAPLVIEAGGER